MLKFVALNGSLEMPPEPRNATMNQTDSAVELTIPNFQIQQVCRNRLN